MEDAGSINVDDVSEEPRSAFSRPVLERRDSDELYSSIRNSNPFAGNMPLVLGAMLED